MPEAGFTAVTLPNLPTEPQPEFRIGIVVWAPGLGALEEGESVVRVLFGHGARHLAGTGLSQAEVEAAIAQEVRAVVSTASATGEWWWKIAVGGQAILYRAYTVAEGVIKVGTYYPVPWVP